jgi:hypothetical protein
MSMRRFTRLTNAFSKKAQNLEAAVSLHFMHYNFCRIHQTLRYTPAMEAGVSKRPWSVEDVVNLLEGGGMKLRRLGMDVKMKWWGWLGIAVAFWPVSNSSDYLIGAFMNSLAAEGDGLSQIGRGIQMFAVMLPMLVGRLAAALMIWVSARE